MICGKNTQSKIAAIIAPSTLGRYLKVFVIFIFCISVVIDNNTPTGGVICPTAIVINTMIKNGKPTPYPAAIGYKTGIKIVNAAVISTKHPIIRKNTTIINKNTVGF